MKTFSKKPTEKITKRISCPICDSLKFVQLWRKDVNNFVKCKSCGHVYQNPQPLENELIERYDKEYFQYEIENEEKFFNLIMLGFKDIDFLSIEERIFKKNNTFSVQPSFLDVGCATGCLLQEMVKKGWNAKGVEVCSSSAKYGIEKKKLDIRISTIENAGFDPESFDVIHCSHLIEHLTSPDTFVSEVYRLLKPNGIFIVTTPNIKSFQAILFGYKWRSAIADHMQLFSFRTLKKLLKDNKFVIEKKVSWGGLAQGSAPLILKRIMDILAKKADCGDVMSLVAIKQREKEF